MQDCTESTGSSPTTVESALGRFRTAARRLSDRYLVDIIGPDILTVAPNTLTASRGADDSRDVALTLGAIIHGNETAGLEVLTRFLEDVLTGSVPLLRKIGIALGNVAAARLDQRFIDRDLNRSFGMNTPDSTQESKRAKQIEQLLRRTEFFLDLHQTREPSKTPFFIFPWQQRSYDFAQSISPKLPIVTHWGGSFSKDGKCSDEYVNSCGGTGITLELGQCGFSESQIAIGIDAIRSAMIAKNCVETSTLNWSISSLGSELIPTEFCGAMYTWNGTIAYPQSGSVQLNDGLINFQRIKKDLILGWHDDEALRSPVDALILFPKYIRPGSPDENLARPAELCRFLKQINLEDVPR